MTLFALVAGIEKVVFERKKAVIKVLGIILKLEMVLLTKEWKSLRTYNEIEGEKNNCLGVFNLFFLFFKIILKLEPQLPMFEKERQYFGDHSSLEVILVYLWMVAFMNVPRYVPRSPFIKGRVRDAPS